MRMSLYRKLFALTVAGWLLPYCVSGQNLSSFLDSIEQVKDSSFIQKFNFEDYFLLSIEQPFSSFVKDISLIEEQNEALVNEFLDSVYASMIKDLGAFPSDYDKILLKLRLGESLLQLDGIKRFIYPAFGDLILQGLTTHLDQGLAENKFSPQNKEVQYLIRRLRENKFFVNVPTSDWDKGLDHLKKGNLGYLARKVRLKQPILFYCSAILFIVFIGLGVNWLRLRTIKRSSS